MLILLLDVCTVYVGSVAYVSEVTCCLHLQDRGLSARSEDGQKQEYNSRLHVIHIPP
jgi:hypothetical protein